MPRQYERSGVRKEIVLESASGKREMCFSDLSLGGCYIETINAYRPGETVSFDVRDDEGQPLRFTGRVAYVHEGFGFGFEFADLSLRHQRFLEAVLPPGSEDWTDSES